MDKPYARRIKLSNSSLKILLNPTKSVILYSKTIFLNVRLKASSISTMPYQVNPSDLKFKVEIVKILQHGYQMIQFDGLNLHETYL